MAATLPGFTADTALDQGRVFPQRAPYATALALGATVVPQLWMSSPGSSLAWMCKHGECNWEYVMYGGSDPGGWGVDPGLGDDWYAKSCAARCRRLIDPLERAQCLETC